MYLLRNCPKWLLLDLIDDKSIYVHVVACYPQATSHLQSWYWPRSMSPRVVTRPQWLGRIQHARNRKYIFIEHTFTWTLELWQWCLTEIFFHSNLSKIDLSAVILRYSWAKKSTGWVTWDCLYLAQQKSTEIWLAHLLPHNLTWPSNT